MATTRDNAVRTFVGGIFGMTDVTQTAGTTEIPTNWQQFLNMNALYLSSLHPDGWSWQKEIIVKTAQKESVDITALDSASIFPRTYGITSVQMRRTATATVAWHVLTFVPWEEMVQKPEFNRTAAAALTGENQRFYTIKFDTTAPTTAAVSLESYKYSYAHSATPTLDFDNLDYQITYIKSLPTITVGGNTDDGYLWPATYDTYFNWAMAANVAIVRKQPDVYAMCAQEAEKVAMQLLISEGVSADKVKFPRRDVLADKLEFAIRKEA
jgi:hypothetical protein